MIDICMVVCNRERITRTSITEIQRRTMTPHRLLVLDNGSKDGAEQLLRELLEDGKIDVLIRLEQNMGIHWAHNKLLAEVDTPLYVSTDNDIVPQKPNIYGDWLAALIQLSITWNNFGAIACRPHMMIGDSAARIFHRDAPAVVERGWVGAVLRLMRTDAVREAGGWQDKIEPGRNNEERWIAQRLKERGLKVGYARDVRAIHLWGEPERGEDSWGYPLALFSSANTHGHRDIWPPPSQYNWHRIGIDWDTCK